MKKEIGEFAKYLKENFFLILVLIVLLTPSIWKITDMYYEGRLETYKLQIEALKIKNEELERKKDDLKDLVISSQEGVIDWSKIKSN